MPSRAVARVAAASMTASSSHGDWSPSRPRPANVSSAAKAPTVNTSPCENLITSSTPKKSVKPTATSAYIMPSISPFVMYCASKPASIGEKSPPSCPALCRASTPCFQERRRGWHPNSHKCEFGILEVTSRQQPTCNDKPGHDASMLDYFCPGSLRLPEAYSLSSHSTNLPSCTTYLVMTGT